MIRDLPVLLLNFNRPDLTRGLIDNLRLVKPSRVFVSIDGPRDSHPDDAARCQQVFESLAAIDWPCELNVKRHGRNQGLRLAVRTALAWFFEAVEYGVILEDDIRFGEDFFTYCEEMGERYRDDLRIGAVSGNNLIAHLLAPGTLPDHEFLCTIFHCWGWATWRDRWAAYDDNVVLDDALFGAPLEDRVSNDHARTFWRHARLALAANKISSWAWRMQFSQWRANRYFVTPPHNLCVNEGFGEEATNTAQKPIWAAGLTIGNFDVHRPVPLPIAVHDAFDWYENKALFG
ncbi:hypothetical protein KSF73_12050 [Burkholderiaceae bacterium DAT-1]|nr:hypothetical protein [Burkholderiaceae bacterium DAT-1]